MKIEIDVPDNRIADMLCGAFEGGSNYWCQIDGYLKPTGELFEWNAPGKKTHKHVQWPMSEGGVVIVRDIEDDNKEHTLDLPTIHAGVRAMATEEPSHFADMLTENDDATTADVFLQCCLFGKVVYG